jgi:4-hydroxy-tetrahydrodipicolinate reductase
MNQAFAPCECIIDFTFPEVTLQVARYASETGKAMVIGSTGFTEDQKQTIASRAVNVPVVMSPNMSIGVNVLFRIVRMAAGLLDESYDAEIVEAHHRMKKDAPSGTALALARERPRVAGWTLNITPVMNGTGSSVHGRQERSASRRSAPGTSWGSTWSCLQEGERIEITHKAHTRENFARGA